MKMSPDTLHYLVAGTAIAVAGYMVWCGKGNAIQGMASDIVNARTMAPSVGSTIPSYANYNLSPWGMRMQPLIQMPNSSMVTADVSGDQIYGSDYY